MEHNNKELEQFVNKLMKEVSYEKPSEDFTNKVMDNIEEIKTSLSATTYEPLISSRAWIGIALCLITALCLVYFNNDSSPADWIPQLRWPEITMNPFEEIDLNLPSIVTYALALFALMLIVQASFLKTYLNNRINY